MENPDKRVLSGLRLFLATTLSRTEVRKAISSRRWGRLGWNDQLLPLRPSSFIPFGAATANPLARNCSVTRRFFMTAPPLLPKPCMNKITGVSEVGLSGRATKYDPFSTVQSVVALQAWATGADKVRKMQTTNAEKWE
ncbi:hypothetical protein [Shimia sp.]|uniref:hypothetical protein n=1 Tax=Shimia sp. TaxID=1954381 RepID=UPI0032994093